MQFFSPINNNCIIRPILLLVLHYILRLSAIKRTEKTCNDHCQSYNRGKTRGPLKIGDRVIVDKLQGLLILV